ncbi:flavin monoamine oxidase family protein [Variovorax sp. GT1P44]|uniref:flavin monoamine oxidase family protein n=1 Tax=Variovorax sp. GT1P44 TaxID=3443742 RepID=UPI003F447669
MPHIAIVGAGIAGLATAYRLRQGGFEGPLSVLDKGLSSGGRLWSESVAGDPLVMEYGAGRFHAQRHRRLNALCDQLNLPVVPFDYRACPSSQRSESREGIRRRWHGVLVELLEAARSQVGEYVSFASFSAHVLGASTAFQLQSICGYDSLFNPALPVEAGLSILTHHPETQYLFEGHTDHWCTLRDGFQSLPRALAAELQGTVDFRFDTALERVEPLNDGSYRLRLGGRRTGTFQEMRADQLVLATPLQDLRRIDGLQSLMPKDVWRRLESIPLLKGCIAFDRAWWRSPDEAQCVIADTLLRKVYVTPGSNALWFYCDGASARKLHSMLEATGTFPMQLLESHLGTPIPARVHARSHRWKFWENGISFFRRSGESSSYADFAQLAPGISICSDICTDHLGWVEGSLASAEAVAAHGHRLASSSATPHRDRRLLVQRG